MNGQLCNGSISSTLGLVIQQKRATKSISVPRVNASWESFTATEIKTFCTFSKELLS